MNLILFPAESKRSEVGFGTLSRDALLGELAIVRMLVAEHGFDAPQIQD